MSIKKRIQILLAFLVGVPFALLLGETYHTGRGTLLRQMHTEATYTARLQAALLESTFEAPRQATEAVARALEADPQMTPETVRALLRSSLAQVEGAYGFGLALLDPAGPGKPLLFYTYREAGLAREVNLNVASYEYQAKEWFVRPLAEKRAIWTHPYLDTGGGGLAMITFAVPILRSGKPIGVAEVDVSLERMVSQLRQLKPGGNGHVFLVGPDGAVLAHPNLPILDEPGAATGIPRLGGPLQQMLSQAGEDAMATKDPFTQQQVWLVELPLAPLSASRGGPGWSLIVSWPEEIRLKPLSDLGKRFLVLYLALGGAALLFLNRSMHDLISRPLARLAMRAKRYAQGDFGDLSHPPEDAAELQELSQAVQLLGRTLQDKAERKHPEGGP